MSSLVLMVLMVLIICGLLGGRKFICTSCSNEVLVCLVL